MSALPACLGLLAHRHETFIGGACMLLPLGSLQRSSSQRAARCAHMEMCYFSARGGLSSTAGHHSIAMSMTASAQQCIRRHMYDCPLVGYAPAHGRFTAAQALSVSTAVWTPSTACTSVNMRV